MAEKWENITLNDLSIAKDMLFDDETFNEVIDGDTPMTKEIWKLFIDNAIKVHESGLSH